MPIANVSRFKIGRADAARVARSAAPIFKSKGVTTVQMGFCYSGPHTGEIIITLTYPDWTTFAKVTEELQQDKDYQRLFAEVSGSLLDRSIMIVEDF